LLLTQPDVATLLAKSGRSLNGLWAIGTLIAVMIVVTVFLVSQGEL